MDKLRLFELAGVSNTISEQQELSINELELLEKRFQSKYDLSVETEEIPVEELQKRLEASIRALGIANKVRDPEQKKRHLSRIMSNMNTIRNAVQHMLKQVDNEF